MALMVSITASMAASSLGKFKASLYSGHRDVIRNLSPESARLGRAWKISSVMKGMKGCSSFKSSVST